MAAYSCGPRPLNSTRRHGTFLKSTCHSEPSDTRQDIRDTHGIFLKFDRRHESILEATWDTDIQVTRDIAIS